MKKIAKVFTCVGGPHVTRMYVSNITKIGPYGRLRPLFLQKKKYKKAKNCPLGPKSNIHIHWIVFLYQRPPARQKKLGIR